MIQVHELIQLHNHITAGNGSFFIPAIWSLGSIVASQSFHQRIFEQLFFASSRRIMAIQKITIEQLPSLGHEYPVLDVRSPGEFIHAQIPGAHSLPLFSDEERKQIGTTYKQVSRERAIKIGLDFFGVKMRSMLEAAEKIINSHTGLKTKESDRRSVIVHCWRGGMRSSAVAWLLNFYGFNVYQLEGGYKAYRNWVLAQLEKDYDLSIIGGYTGSGKTKLLHAMQSRGYTTIDLEGLANHKGSAFGALGQPKQPSQEMFENLLATQLYGLRGKQIWVEDESRRIGVLNIPNSFWNMMRSRPLYFIDIPFEERLQNIISEYGSHAKELLINAILRIQKKLGPLETKTAIGFLIEDNTGECFKILLAYYDKLYEKGLHNRQELPLLLNKIACKNVDTVSNTENLISCLKVNA